MTDKMPEQDRLAIELAKRTRFLRDVVAQQLEAERSNPDVLSGFFEAFQTYLSGTLTREEFADLFAQTITYGLFAARRSTPTALRADALVVINL